MPLTSIMKLPMAAVSNILAQWRTRLFHQDNLHKTIRGGQVSRFHNQGHTICIGHLFPHLCRRMRDVSSARLAEVAGPLEPQLIRPPCEMLLTHRPLSVTHCPMLSFPAILPGDILLQTLGSMAGAPLLAIFHRAMLPQQHGPRHRIEAVLKINDYASLSQRTACNHPRLYPTQVHGLRHHQGHRSRSPAAMGVVEATHSGTGIGALPHATS